MSLNRTEQPQLLIRILEGAHKGTRAPVREGLTIGRKEGDLILKDPKMSVKHARIEWRENEWVLVDLGSSNKIKVEGERYGEVVIYPGLQFIVGSTVFEVLEKPKVIERPPAPEGGFEFTGSVEVPVEALTWREILSALLSKAAPAKDGSWPAAPVPVRPFPALLRLEFISGVQHGTVWNIGYGPREAGLNSFDLPLFDDAATESCFHLDTAEGKVLFRSAGGATVRLNGKLAPEIPTELRSGDRIEIGKTRIRVVLA